MPATEAAAAINSEEAARRTFPPSSAAWSTAVRCAMRSARIGPTRRSFVRRATSAFAAFGLFGAVPRAANGHLVWQASEWKLAKFQKLLNEPTRIKQVFDVVEIADRTALTSIKNALSVPAINRTGSRSSTLCN